MRNKLHTSGSDTYPLMRLGDLEIRTWAAIVAGDLRSARQHLNRASALLDQEGARGVFDPSATTAFAWLWLEMETGEHRPAQTDHDRGKTGQVSLPATSH